jgi:ketosteroid isomerase-like protein
MSTDNVQIVSDIYDGFILRGSIDTLFASLHPEVTVTEAASLPFGGVYQGIAGVQQLFGQMFETWEDLQIAKEAVFGSGDQVFALLRLTGRSRATGKPVDMPIAELWTLREGKVVSLVPFYFDAGEVARICQPDPK